jgi:hypothetical protein
MHRHTDRQTGRQTDRQTSRQTDRQTHRHTDTQRHRDTKKADFSLSLLRYQAMSQRTRRVRTANRLAAGPVTPQQTTMMMTKMMMMVVKGMMKRMKRRTPTVCFTATSCLLVCQSF